MVPNSGFQILCLFFRHIKEELDNIYTEEEIKNMNHDELAFTFFS